MNTNLSIEKKIELFFEKFNDKYFEHHPIEEMINYLEEMGIRAKTEFPIIKDFEHETSSTNKLLIKDTNDILVNLYRASRGYEVNIYKIKPLLKEKPKTIKIKP